MWRIYTLFGIGALGFLVVHLAMDEYTKDELRQTRGRVKMLEIDNRDKTAQIETLNARIRATNERLAEDAQ